MTRNDCEQKISDFQGRVLHAETQRRAAAMRGDQKEAAKWADKHVGDLATLNALYDLLAEAP